ncbi:hypothetical protein ACFVS9_32575 [Streptomyces sp. NPDC058008]
MSVLPQLGEGRSATEWDEFLARFELRKVALGTCGRDYATL